MIKHFVVVRVDRATRLKSKVQIYFIPVLVIRLLTPSGILTNNDFIECVKVTKVCRHCVHIRDSFFKVDNCLCLPVST